MYISAMLCLYWCFFFFKQKTAYEMRISDWSSDVCSSDLALARIETGRPDVDAKAMFALDAVVPLENEGMFVAEATVALVLRGDEPIAQRTADAAPRYRPFRRHESVRTARVVAIGDALETVDSVARIALNKTCAGKIGRAHV